MPDAVANGVRLFYQQQGDGPDVVLVHAVTSNQAVWMFAGLPDALAEAGYRVTTYDLRGHGASERPATGYTSAEMAADLRGLLAELGLGPAVLVGHSFGGVIGMHAAAEFPEIIRGVILSDSFFPALRSEEPNFGKMAIWENVREHYATVGVELSPVVDFAGLFRKTAELDAESYKKLEEAFGVIGRGWLRQLPLLAETSCGDEVLTESGLTAERLRGVACPVVALYDEFSPFLATCRWLETNLPRCEAEIIPAAKHLAVVENTAGFTDAVKRHLKKII